MFFVLICLLNFLLFNSVECEILKLYDYIVLAFVFVLLDIEVLVSDEKRVVFIFMIRG